MKVSSVILGVTLGALIVLMFVTNVLLKKEYDKLDKNDSYWTYGKILEQPFKHVKIEGGNITQIAFEPSNKPSVRIFKYWQGYENKVVKANVQNDTLYLTFPNNVTEAHERRYLGWNTMVRIFSPELLSVDGYDTNFKITGFKQKNLGINLSGKSKVEVESYIQELDSLNINQRDSSVVVFKMSAETKGKAADLRRTETVGQASIHAEPIALNMPEPTGGTDGHSKSWESLYIKTIVANVQGASLLDVGHTQVNTLRLNIADNSAIMLSGNSLRKFKK